MERVHGSPLAVTLTVYGTRYDLRFDHAGWHNDFETALSQRADPMSSAVIAYAYGFATAGGVPSWPTMPRCAESRTALQSARRWSEFYVQGGLRFTLGVALARQACPARA